MAVVRWKLLTVHVLIYVDVFVIAPELTWCKPVALNANANFFLFEGFISARRTYPTYLTSRCTLPESTMPKTII